mmetsp:Transcript_54202/g.144529  ORF Transcript_54202/g.144529 Transcript_54202/m.144529 type:complete len:181 (+) Transcript_54202:675-1217(+)
MSFVEGAHLHCPQLGRTTRLLTKHMKSDRKLREEQPSRHLLSRSTSSRQLLRRTIREIHKFRHLLKRIVLTCSCETWSGTRSRAAPGVVACDLWMSLVPSITSDATQDAWQGRPTPTWSARPWGPDSEGDLLVASIVSASDLECAPPLGANSHTVPQHQVVFFFVGDAVCQSRVRQDSAP